MKRILGIIASPRRLGNCEILVKEISRQVPEPHALDLIRLPEFRINTCKACYTCLFAEMRCPQPDDLNTIIEALVRADALIVAAPTYFLGAHSVLKRLLDRGLSFYGSADRIWGKPAVGVTVAGIEHREGYAKLNVDSFLKLILAEIKGSEIFFGALPGEVFLNEDNKQKAAGLGAALFGNSAWPGQPCCNLCGGDSFRFIGPGRVKCLLCGNPGSVTMEDGKTVFQINSADHEMVLSQEAARVHLEWLRSMKDRFIQNRKALKQITVQYLKDGTWIRPT
ncbi:MAG: flavodoxin family protein [Deltaproteobacteria bacterium]|nr:flavodoxin family protein [Deltaproteobacteria bacterium]